MKNNKGFTMVEIIAVIVILALIMILVFPSVGEVLFSSKKSISELTKKNLEEAGKTFAEAVYICDDLEETVAIIHSLGYDTVTMPDAGNVAVTNCKHVRELLKTGISVSVDFLKQENYFTDNSNNCSEELMVYLNDPETMKITVDLDSVVCQK